MNDELMELPKGWITTKLGECLRLINGRAYLRHELLDQGTPIIRIQNLNGGDKWFYSDLQLDRDKYCDKGDLLFAWSATFGPFIWQGSRSIYHYHIWKIEPFEVIDQKFAYYLLEKITQAVKAAAHGVAMPHMTKQGMENWQIQIPPLNEQKRIVAKIEELRERSQKARSHLSAIPNLCNKFRQSVLAAAFRGDLTADWREQNPDVEPAQVLLERIGKELGQNLADVQTEIDRTDDEIPSTWAWAKLKLMIKKIQPGNNFLCPEVPVTETTVGLVKISAVTWGTFNPKETKTVADPSKVDPNLFIQPGDLLVTRANTLELVGASVVVDEIHYKIMLSDKVWRVDILEVDKKYINFYLRSKDGRKEIESRATGNQLSMRNISQNAFRDVVIAIPPIEEQKEIGRQIESCFNSINQSKQAYQETKDYLNQLDRSILAKAFRGELVEQDPNDEPASILLERIRAEREQQTQGKAKKPGKKGQRTIKTDPP